MSHQSLARRRGAYNVLVPGVVAIGLTYAAGRNTWAGVAALAVVVVATSLLTWRAATLRVDQTDEGLVVRNLFRTTRVAWSEVVAFESRWALSVSRRHYRAVCPVAVTRRRRVTLLALAGNEPWVDEALRLRRWLGPGAPGSWRGDA